MVRIDVSHLVFKIKIAKEIAKEIAKNFLPIPRVLVVYLWGFITMNWCFDFGHHIGVMIFGIIGINFAI